MSRLGTIVRTFVDRVTNGDLTATETETRTYPAPPALATETKNGGIAVRGEDRDDVAVTITKRATSEDNLDDARVVASGGEAEPLALRVEHDDNLDRGRVVVDLDVAVPRDVPLVSAATKNGGVETKATTGDADLTTKNGSVHATDHDGSLEVTTKNGSVEATDVAGDLAVAAKNGRVTVDGLGGFLDARTKNGSIEGRGVAGVDRAESKNGSIDLDVDAVHDDATVATKAGSIRLAVGPDVDADVALATRMGSIDAPAIDQSASGLGRLELHGAVGDGSHSLTVESEHGSVELARRAEATTR